MLKNNLMRFVMRLNLKKSFLERLGRHFIVVMFQPIF